MNTERSRAIRVWINGGGQWQETRDGWPERTISVSPVGEDGEPLEYLPEGYGDGFPMDEPVLIVPLDRAEQVWWCGQMARLEAGDYPIEAPTDPKCWLCGFDRTRKGCGPGLFVEPRKEQE